MKNVILNLFLSAAALMVLTTAISTVYADQHRSAGSLFPGQAAPTILGKAPTPAGPGIE